jgi:hypothetical protein
MEETKKCPTSEQMIRDQKSFIVEKNKDSKRKDQNNNKNKQDKKTTSVDSDSLDSDIISFWCIFSRWDNSSNQDIECCLNCNHFKCDDCDCDCDCDYDD